MKVGVCVFVVAGLFASVIGQADKDKSFTYDQYTLEEKARWLAQTLVDHPDTFTKILRIGDSGKDLLSIGQGDPKAGMFLNFILDMIPGLLQSSETKAMLGIVVDELNRVNITDVMLGLQNQSIPLNSTQAKQMMSGAMLQRFNKLRAVRRILTRHSARDFLYMRETDTINDVCYNDMMNFVDTLVSLQFPPRSDLNYTFVPWALTMFDSYGKPQGGLTKGALYFIGSYDQCKSVEARLPPGVLLGNRTLTAPVNFNGRFCRASFPLPNSFVSGLGVDTHGIQLSLSWGMCVPNSCHSDDIAQMFGLGVLKDKNLTANKVVCFEETDITKDNSGLTASIILLIFVIIAAFSTVVDAGTAWVKNQRKQQKDKELAKFTALEIPQLNGNGKVNGAYVPDPGEGTSHVVMETKLEGLPPAYMHHKNDKGDLGAEYMNSGNSGKYKMNGTSAPAEKKPAQHKPKQTLFQGLVKAFSLYTNMPRVFNAAKNPNAIHSIHGIRFFSILWIILGHTYNYGVISENGNPTTENLIDADKLFKRFTFQGVMAGGFSVDTFFMMSGLLVTYLTLKDLKKRGKPDCGYMGMFYFHRFWRLTPVYMLVVMAFGCLYPYVGEGPLWPGVIKPAEYCKTNWWTNLLYINNLVGVDKQCMGWSWYLADDMQFYIISPIFIFLLHFKPVIGIIATVLMALTGVSSAFAKEFIFGGDMFSMKESPDFWREVYITPWCRVAAYCVGILFGYIMFKFKRNTLTNIPAAIGWVLTWMVGFTLCYVTFDYRKKDAEPWARWRMALFESLSRPLWAMCVAWIIFACHNGKGGFIDSILSFKGLIPFSRLTYAAYLMHPILMMLFVFSKRSLLYVNDWDLAYLFMGHAMSTYLVAFFLSLVFEAPFLTLEKLIFRRGGHSS